MTKGAKRKLTLLITCCLFFTVFFFLLYGVMSFARDVKYRLAQNDGAVITGAELEEIILKNQTAFIGENEFIYTKLPKDYYTNCSQEEQLEILAYIGALEAKHLGIALPGFRLADLREDVIGYYTHEQRQIVLNTRFLSNEKHAVQTVIHEMFHAYQYACIQEFTGESDLLWAREIEAWRENAKKIENDLDSREGIVNYYTSAMEASAREYTEKRQELYFLFIDSENTSEE